MVEHPSPVGRLERLRDWIFQSRTAAGLLAATFGGMAILLASGNIFLNDEGVFTFTFVRALWRDFWPIFFVHKGKPANMLLEVLPAGFGYEGYLVGHALFGAAAVYLVSRAARAMGVIHPNFAGAFLATSGIFAVSSANGYPNSLGAFLLALFLWLYYSERLWLAGLVLGLLPLSRYELAAVVVAFLALKVLRDRDLRFLGLTLLAPAVYYLAGAIYWEDLLWIPHTLINPDTLPRELQTWGHGFDLQATLSYLARSLRANSPFLLGFFLVGLDGRHRRTLEPMLIATAFYVILSILQFAELQRFALTLRHHVGALPLVALAVAIGLSPTGLLARRILPRVFPDEDRRRRLMAWGPGFHLGLLGLAVVLLGFQLSVGLPEEREQHERTHTLTEALTERGLFHGQPVYTDLYVAEQDRCAGFRETHYLVNGSIVYELEAATFPPKRASVFQALRDDGWIFSPEALPLVTGALYLISGEERSASWRARLEEAGAERFVLDRWMAYRLEP